MRRLTALLVLFAAALLLAACAAPAPTPAPAALPSPTPQPTATPQPPTATPTPTATPSPTPLPAGLGDLLGQLRAAWSTNPTYAPATAEQVTQLAKDLGIEPAKLGQVYRVEAENGAVFWASAETGQTYAIRQVPDHWKYENGKLEIVEAKEQAYEVIKLTNELKDHWSNFGVEVKTDSSLGAWLYFDMESNQWEKVPTSGFDSEVIYQQAVWALEQIGRIKPGEQVDPQKIYDLLQQLAAERSKETGEYYVGGPARKEGLLEANYRRIGHIAINLGANWIHFKAGGKGVDGLVLFALEGESRSGRNDNVVYPLLLGIEKQDNIWESSMGQYYGYSNISIGSLLWTENGRIKSNDPDKLGKLFNTNVSGVMLAQGFIVMTKDFLQQGSGSLHASETQKWLIQHLPFSYVTYFSKPEYKLELTKGGIEGLMKGQLLSGEKIEDVGLLTYGVSVEDGFDVPENMRAGLK